MRVMALNLNREEDFHVENIDRKYTDEIRWNKIYEKLYN